METPSNLRMVGFSWRLMTDFIEYYSKDMDEWLRQLLEVGRLNLPIPSEEWRAKTFILVVKLIIRYREIMRDVSKAADNGYLKAEMNASIITIEDNDFYSCCGYVRDFLDIELKKSRVDVEE